MRAGAATAAVSSSPQPQQPPGSCAPCSLLARTNPPPFRQARQRDPQAPPLQPVGRRGPRKEAEEGRKKKKSAPSGACAQRPQRHGEPAGAGNLEGAGGRLAERRGVRVAAAEVGLVEVVVASTPKLRASGKEGLGTNGPQQCARSWTACSALWQLSVFFRNLRKSCPGFLLGCGGTQRKGSNE